MKQLSDRISERVAAVEEAKHQEAERARREEDQQEKIKAEKSAKRSKEIARALLQDLSDDTLFDLVSAHVEFINEHQSETAEISFYNPSTDYSNSVTRDIFDKPMLFAIERRENISGKLNRVPIKIISAFSYLREIKELHGAIRFTEIQDRLRELASANINVKFVQHGAEKYDAFAGRYVIELAYRPAIAQKATG